MTRRVTFLAGAATALAAQEGLRRALLAKFRGDVTRLNAGEHASLLSAYAPDAVLHFNPGEHRWAGDHVGRPAIERFLRDFTRARIQGEIKDLAVAGPPWALRLLVRFDDHADGPDGTRIYENRTCLVLRTRWGKVVDHEDFYLDSARIPAFEERLQELGIAPVGPTPAPA